MAAATFVRYCAIALAILPAACSVGPRFERPDPHLPARWSGTATGSVPESSDAESLAHWWTGFQEPLLSSLIERSTADNQDLRAAMLRISEARAQRQGAAAGYLPSLSANASFTRQRLSETTATGAIFTSFGGARAPGAPAFSFPNPNNQLQLGAGASWEIDLFGRVRRSVEAADADLEASSEDRHAILVSLAADVARAYIELRGTQLRMDVTRQSLNTVSELYELTRQRQAVGLTSDLDVANAGAQLSNTEALVPQLDREETQSINQLSLLVGREPDALRAELAAVRPVPQTPPSLPLGLPSDLARRRPDIRAAEARLHAATARIGVSVGNLFPRLMLGANGGVQSEGASDLLKWASRFGSIGPSFEMPIFDRGRWAAVRVQNVRAQEAAVDYERTVLGALHEVENALAACKADRERGASLAAAVDHSRDALDLAKARYSSGVANFIEVLDAQRTLQQNEIALAESTTAISADVVALYRVLGGGWEART